MTSFESSYIYVRHRHVEDTATHSLAASGAELATQRSKEGSRKYGMTEVPPELGRMKARQVPAQKCLHAILWKADLLVGQRTCRGVGQLSARQLLFRMVCRGLGQLAPWCEEAPLEPS